MKNKYEVRGEITAIFLTYKGNEYETLIDTDDLAIAQSFSNTWSMNYRSDIEDFYVEGRVITNKKAKHYKLHRLIMNTPNFMVVDHINHKTLDNRKSVNLRNVTNAENMQNRLHKNGIRGVKWDKRINKWNVTVNINGETLNFGYYENKDEAIDVSKKARAKYQPFSLEAKGVVSDKEIHPFERKRAKKVSGVKGITWHEYSSKWRVRANANGKMTIIGSCEDLSQAISMLNEHLNIMALAN